MGRVISLEVPVTEVRLQQRIEGNYLDDVITIAGHPRRFIPTLSQKPAMPPIARPVPLVSLQASGFYLLGPHR
jgi:hypothetical protein